MKEARARRPGESATPCVSPQRGSAAQGASPSTVTSTGSLSDAGPLRRN